MPKQKFYAVRRGRVPGIYQNWDACSAQVNGFTGAIYKSFESRDEAERFLRAGSAARPPDQTKPRAMEASTRKGSRAPAVQAKPLAVKASPRAVTNAQPDAADVSSQSNAVARIYTDGGCLVNPGPGGYGVVLIAAAKHRELSGGFRRTTNNRMELMACIAGLEAVSAGSPAAVYTDSQYLSNGIAKGWAKRWQAMGWERAGEPVPNADLWQRLLALCAPRTVTFEWLRGHAGHPENERCHVLADEAMRRPRLPPDPGYDPA